MHATETPIDRTPSRVRARDRALGALVLGLAASVLLVPAGLVWRGATRASGVAFAGLSLALIAAVLLVERALRSLHPLGAHGRAAPWRHPWPRPLGAFFDAVANSRLAMVLFEPLPEFAMRSDITDVVYVNYLVDAARLEGLVPKGLELQRLGPDGRYALFTFLTYRHGHFGFRAMGPLRALMPSPVQSNWRVHVRQPGTTVEGIYFVTNAIAHTFMALAARMTTRGMPMHVLDDADVAVDAAGRVRVRVSPGRGSGPDAELELEPCEAPKLEGAWAECFASYRDALQYCVPQDRAMATQPEWGELSRQEIDLGLTPDVCIPLRGRVRSRAAERIAGACEPLCFRVPRVSFLFETELRLPLAAPRVTPSGES